MNHAKEMLRTKKEKEREEIERINRSMDDIVGKNYREQPEPASFTTFNKIMMVQGLKKKSKSKGPPSGSGFGSATRFIKDEEEIARERTKFLSQKGIDRKFTPDPGPGVLSLFGDWMTSFWSCLSSNTTWL